MLQTFKDKYGIAINELIPGGSSGEEIEAIKANQNNPGPQAPDVVDIGFSFGEDNKDLFEPYKVATWDSIPDSAKAADGAWYGDYYGVMAFTTNTAVQANPPKDWADLLKPEYKGQIALDGDPRTSNQAIQAVYAAALANGGSLDNAQPGLDFFKKVVDAGNFVPTDANPGTIVQGATPVALRWSYNGLSHRDEAADNPTIDVTVPRQRSLRWRVRPGHQQVRAAPERSQALDGASLFRRGPAHVARGLLQPDPLRRHGRAWRGPSRPRGQAARLDRRGLPDASPAEGRHGPHHRRMGYDRWRQHRRPAGLTKPSSRRTVES